MADGIKPNEILSAGVNHGSRCIYDGSFIGEYDITRHTARIYYYNIVVIGSKRVRIILFRVAPTGRHGRIPSVVGLCNHVDPL